MENMWILINNGLFGWSLQWADRKFETLFL